MKGTSVLTFLCVFARATIEFLDQIIWITNSTMQALFFFFFVVVVVVVVFVYFKLQVTGYNPVTGYVHNPKDWIWCFELTIISIKSEK